MFHLESSLGESFATTTMLHVDELEVIPDERSDDVSVNTAFSVDG
jgi:hypothetical protein